MKTFVLALATLFSLVTIAATPTNKLKMAQDHSAHKSPSNLTKPNETKPNETRHHSYMGSHGMAIIFGENETLIAHHMPLFYFPHDYQIVYKIKVNSKPQLAKLLALRSKPLISILPDNFDLLKLINKTSFNVSGTVYDGHFERGGKPLFDVDVLFEKALYVEAIVINEQPTKLDMTFDVISIENNDNPLAIKKINEKPSFDALTWVSKYRTEKESSIKCTGIQVKPAIKTTQILNEISRCLGNTPVYLETIDFK